MRLRDINYPQYLCFSFIIFICVTFIAYSGLLDKNSPTEVVKRYYYAIQTRQDQLTFRLLEEFNWTKKELISNERTNKIYGDFYRLRKEHGLIKEFKIIDTNISDNLAEIRLKVKCYDNWEVTDKAWLSKKSGSWKVVSAEIFY